MPQPGRLFDARRPVTVKRTCRRSLIWMGSKKSQVQPSDMPGRKRYSLRVFRPSAMDSPNSPCATRVPNGVVLAYASSMCTGV